MGRYREIGKVCKNTRENLEKNPTPSCRPPVPTTLTLFTPEYLKKILRVSGF